MNCAIYCRFSSENQREGFSIEAQEAECKEFAQKQGWEVKRVYKDEALSGRSDDRDSFQEMLSDAKSPDHPYDYIIVHKFDRFARNTLDSIVQKYNLAKFGVEVISAKQTMIGGDPAANRFLERMYEVMDENYSLNLAQESLKGMKEAAKRGFWNGGKPPLGYRTVPVETDKGIKKKLEIVDAEACIVREIFRLYLQGDGVTAIRNKLTVQNLTCRNGDRFTKTIITAILSSEKYIGAMTFGKKSNKRKRLCFKGFDPVTVYNVHPPIIDRDKWDKVQAMISAKLEMLTTDNYFRDTDYLFSGILKCICGAAMTGESAHGRMSVHHYYVCNEKRRKGQCKAKNIPAKKFELAMLQAIEKEIAKPETVVRFIQDYNKVMGKVKTRAVVNIKNITAEIQKIDQRRNRLFEAIEEGIGIRGEDIAPRIRELNALKDRLMRELEGAQKDNELELIDLTINRGKKFALFYFEQFNAEELYKSKNRVHKAIKTIQIQKDQVAVTCSPDLCLEPFKVRVSRNWLPGNTQHDSETKLFTLVFPMPDVFFRKCL